MAKIEKRDNLYSLAYDDRKESESGWQPRPWGIKPEECFSQARAMEPMEALALARADFTVEPRPLFSVRSTPNANGKSAIRAEGYAAQVRTDLETVLGITGDTYMPVQFSEIMGLLNGTSFKVDACAVLDGGAGFYAQARLGRDPIKTTKGNDYIDTYLTLRSSHDGSTSVLAGWSTTRIVCANTLARATVQAGKSAANEQEGAGKAKHTRNVGEKLLDMDKAIARVDTARKAQLEVYAALARTKVDTATVKATLAATFPNAALDSGKVNTSTTGATRTANVRARVLEIFEKHEHSTPTDGSAWALWQAVTAYTSHESGVRGVTGTDAQVSRWLRSTLEGSDANERALQFLKSVA